MANLVRREIPRLQNCFVCIYLKWVVIIIALTQAPGGRLMWTQSVRQPRSPSDGSTLVTRIN